MRIAVLTLFAPPTAAAALDDWLLSTSSSDFGPATATVSEPDRLLLANGLVEREFSTAPDFACVSFRSLLQRPAAEILRSVQPEALVQLDGITYHIGGLVLPTAGATNCSAEACPTAARLGVWTDPATLSGMVRNDSAFSYESHSLGTPQPRYEWTPGTRHAPSDVDWPPKGVALYVVFSPPASAPAAHRQLRVTLSYELFAGAPVLTKWLTIEPQPGVPPSAVADVVVTGCTVEYLAVTQPFSPLALYSYAPKEDVRLGTPYANNQKAGQGEQYNGLLYVLSDSSHGMGVYWQDDAHVLPNGGAAPGAGEPLLNVSYQYQRDSLGLKPPPPSPPPPAPPAPPGPCPANMKGQKTNASSVCCANPGGRFVHGPNPGEIYPCAHHHPALTVPSTERCGCRRLRQTVRAAERLRAVHRRPRLHMHQDPELQPQLLPAQRLGAARGPRTLRLRCAARPEPA